MPKFAEIYRPSDIFLDDRCESCCIELDGWPAEYAKTIHIYIPSRRRLVDYEFININSVVVYRSCHEVKETI